jgi:hypothetical protein
MNFLLYFNLGIEHITDPMGYDHILFILAMCTNYRLANLKTIVFLVTAFTIGHSLSLALAVLNIIPVNAALIEFLIPVTILMSCFRNIIDLPKDVLVNNAPISNSNYLQYALILFFGLIHGMGFSNFLRETLVADESIFTPLLAFNLGLEIGQILIVLFILVINFVFLEIFRKNSRDWALFISGAIASLAFLLALEKIYSLFNT